MSARRRDRAAAAALVAIVHAGALYVALGGDAAAPRRDPPALATFDVPMPMPAPSPPPAIRKRAAGSSGAAGRSAPRRTIAAPLAAMPLPVSIVAPAMPDPVTIEISDGATGSGTTGDRAGLRTGAEGAGTGATGAGTGGVRARWLSGAIRDHDYPRAARAARVEGVVVARFTVGTDGRARDCRVSASAGEALDVATCRLIERRFRYAPARDAGGAAVPEERGWRQRWWLEP